MSEAPCWEARFVQVETKLGASRRIPLEGVLLANEALEEVMLSPPLGIAANEGMTSVRAFLVHNESLSGAGLQRGDYLLVDVARTADRDGLVLARVVGRYTLQRLSLLSSIAQSCDVVGTFVGIIRRRGFNPRQAIEPTRLADSDVHPPSRLGILRSQLSMLEETRASTRNPRLRRALRNEAELVRKKLQIGAFRN